MSKVKVNSFLLLIFIHVSISLKDVRLHLPFVVSLGEKVPLGCSCDLEGEELYSVKLYKGQHEFLQYIPEYHPPHRLFEVRGVVVHEFNISIGDFDFNLGLSRSKQDVVPTLPTDYKVGSVSVSLVLEDATLYTTGTYGCEVSADQPSYDTKIIWKKVQVLVQPSENPIVSGMKQNYASGDYLNLSCISSNSYPAANISWFINGNKAPSGSVEHFPVIKEVTGLLTSISHLTILVDKIKLKISNSLSVKCISSVLTSHWLSSDIEMTVDEALVPKLDKSPGTGSIRDDPQAVVTKNENRGICYDWCISLFLPLMFTCCIKVYS